MWVKQYLLDDDSVFDEGRVAQIKSIRQIAYSIIEFVAQFENELAKIWNKPKFARNSQLVVPLKTLHEVSGTETLTELVTADGWQAQLEEWEQLEIISADEFPTGSVRSGIIPAEIEDLPVDTRHFSDLKHTLAADGIYPQLTGRLIRSENYQALNTLERRYASNVQTAYIDPPFNTGEDFQYIDKFQDSAWLTLMENRLSIARNLLSEQGSIFLHLDDNANFYGRILMDDVFGERNFRNEIVWWYPGGLKAEPSYFPRKHDTILFYSQSEEYKFASQRGDPEDNALYDRWKEYSCDGETILYEDFPRSDKVKFKDYKRRFEASHGRPPKEGDILYRFEGALIDDVWDDCPDVFRLNEKLGFDTQKPESLLQRIIDSTSEEDDIILDFFAGSGTALAVAHKMGRKWIGVEQGEFIQDFYYDTDAEEEKIGLRGRMKQVVANDGVNEPCGITEDEEVDWSGGGAFLYYELEQYEDVLRKCTYDDSSPFSTDENMYEQYVFLNDVKLLDSLVINDDEEQADIDLTRLYEDVDIAETLANLKGKDIERATDKSVTFDDGEEVVFENLTVDDVKPLLWWS